MKRISLSFLLLALLTSIGLGQVTLRSTTLSTGVAASDRYIYVASATGIEVGDIAFVDREAMRVREISGTRLNVLRGLEGQAAAHASGAVIYIDDKTYFSTTNRNGPCTATAEVVLPVVNIATGKLFNCISSTWVEFVAGEPATQQNIGTANTGVTAVEFGNGRHHVTKLTFSGLPIAAITGGANLAVGKLLYTLPAGAILVKSAYMSVALAGTDAPSAIVADTPDTGIGTTIGSGVQALLSGVAGAENILTGQTSNDVNGTAEVKTVGDQVLVIEAAGAHTVHLNVADGWAAGGDTMLKASGTVVLEWVLLQ